MLIGWKPGKSSTSRLGTTEITHPSWDASLRWQDFDGMCCSSLNEDTLDYLYVSWVVANIMMESSCCFGKYNRNLGGRFFKYLFAWKLEQIVVYSSTPTNQGELMESGGEMAASYCPSFIMKVMVWYIMSVPRWRSTCILVMIFWRGYNWHNVYNQRVIVEFSLQSHKYFSYGGRRG
jgi:hypothetical protein